MRGLLTPGGLASAAGNLYNAAVRGGVADLRLETAPGGHLGVLTGRAARATTWRRLDAQLDVPAPRRRAA